MCLGLLKNMKAYWFASRKTYARTQGQPGTSSASSPQTAKGVHTHTAVIIYHAPKRQKISNVEEVKEILQQYNVRIN